MHEATQEALCQITSMREIRTGPFVYVEHAQQQYLWSNTELPKYYARLQIAVTHGLGCLACRQVGPQTDAAPKHSLLFQFSLSPISSNVSSVRT